MSDSTARRLIYALFALSGFAGLIYESIWSHYLKLFLGHAAYAQSLVLAIFMGGMALGAWLVARRSERLRNLLVAYAVVEGLLALAGIFFHPLYQGWMDIAYYRVIPALSQSPDAIALVQVFKWTSAALLILPQTILLGMTFPLIAGALVRLSGGRPGRTIAVLYFSNSLGASLGVLTSGFVLIQWVGLPGTSTVAGLINAFLALAVLLIARRSNYSAAAIVPDPEIAARPPLPARRLLLLAAALTGTASFIYEIAWVRMLSIVLGSSTHAFELMLSAFIMGLALGGLWVRRRVDVIADLPRFLGYIQIVMGVCALGSLIAYNYSFEAMAWIFHTVEKTDAGYRQFNLLSQAIAFGVMLPATLCAGMTLPLITAALLRTRAGERSIGQVYSVNTLGSIVGVFVAVHLLLPQLGLKGAIVVGAGIDLLLGAALLLRGTKTPGRDRRVAAVAAMCLLAAVLSPGINQGKIVSSVMRSGIPDVSDRGEVLFHRDGKTASISVFQRDSGLLSLYTNGKAVAAVQRRHGGVVSEDESTMTQLGVYPLAVHRAPERVAVIGFGVGMTADVILADQRVKQLDIIEIEEQVLAGAAQFAPRFERALNDPRSTVFIEDARTFFALAGRRYDVIVSEPSNLWVSGVSSLYTRQFYRLASRNLDDDGVFAQWFHVYELDLDLATTILKAAAAEFRDYQLYAMNGSDVLLLASNAPIATLDINRLLGPGEVGDQLYRVAVRTASDMHLRWLGHRDVLQPLFERYPAPANDDFFPYLDLAAARTRFLGINAEELITLPSSVLPVQEMLDPNPFAMAVRDVTFTYDLAVANKAPALASLLAVAQGGQWPMMGRKLTAAYQAMLARRVAYLGACPAASPERWRSELVGLAGEMESILSPTEQDLVWDWLLAPGCAGGDLHSADWVSLVRAVAARDAAAMQRIALRVLTGGPSGGAGSAAMEGDLRQYALGAALLGSLALGEQGAASTIWGRYGADVIAEPELPVYLQLLAALAQDPPARPGGGG